jgi:hypothetical protein
MMEAENTSEILVHFYETTQFNNPENNCVVLLISNTALHIPFHLPTYYQKMKKSRQNMDL